MATNFENFKISLDFPINFRKSHQISKNYLKSSDSYGQKTFGGVPKDPPGLNRVKVSWIKAYQISCLFIFISIYPLTKRLKGLAVEMYKMKRLLN